MVTDGVPMILYVLVRSDQTGLQIRQAASGAGRSSLRLRSSPR
jgi:hypothetical protein